MHARIAHYGSRLLVLTFCVFLSACSHMQSAYYTMTTTSYRYNEDNVAFREDEFIENQYDILYQGDMTVVINKKVNLCDYQNLLFVRVSNHSTWVTDPVRNSVMKNFTRQNQFFKMIKTSEPVAYINAKPYPGIGIQQDDEFWYSENDPVTLAWLDRFVHEPQYIVADAILNELNIDAGLLREYAFELRFLESDEGAVIVSFLNRRASLNVKPEGVIANTIERASDWLGRVGSLCAKRPAKPAAPVEEDCIYEK